MKKLNCNGCTKLKSIPYIPSLERLHCGGCTSLKNIPDIPGLKFLVCAFCRMIIHRPKAAMFDFTGCVWINHRHNFWYKDNISKLIVLQKWFRKCLSSKKLIRIIPILTEIFYSPYSRGALLASKSFEKASRP